MGDMPDATTHTNILIVDDDQGLLRLLERTLKREGFITATASSGKAAMEWLARNTADLMLLDLKLRDIDGKELIDRLASVGRSLPFIIVTGRGDEKMAVDMMKRGALDYLVKGVQFVEFVPEVVRHALIQTQQQARLAAAEESLREREARFRLMADQAPVLIWMSGPDKLCTWFNRPWLEFTGRTLEQESGNGWAEGVHPDDLARCLDHYGKAFDARTPFVLEYRLRRHDGEWRWVYDQGNPMRTAEGTFTGYIGSCIDITEQKRAAESLRQGAARLRGTLDSMIEGCQIIGFDWRYSYVNAAAARHGRRTPEELLGHTIMEIHPGIENAELFGPLRRCMEERKPCRMETEFIFPDGLKALFELSIQPVPEGILVLSYDNTERKRLEKEVLEISERERSRIGQDLHDGLCQHLAGIEFRLLGLKQKLQDKAKKQAAEATELARLVREGIEQTRILARGLSPVMLEADGLTNALHELAIDTEKAFDISCSFNCPTPISVQNNAVATHLYRIAQEAVQNAIRHGKAQFIVINLFTQNDRIVLGVKDDGVGFPRKPRKQDGMGLRVMQYRAGMIGGSLVVQRDPEGGTSVVCSLRAESMQRNISATIPGPPRGLKVYPG